MRQKAKQLIMEFLMQLACFQATCQNMQLNNSVAYTHTQHAHLCVTYISLENRTGRGAA